jgi:hypothetical protein
MITPFIVTEEGKPPQFTPEVASMLLKASKEKRTSIPLDILDPILHYMQLFNELSIEENLNEAFLMIHRIEQFAYEWLRTCNAGATDRDREAMFCLLAALEENHVRLVSRSVAQKAPLWISPGIDMQTGQEMQDLWQSIIYGEGNIKIFSKNQAFVSWIWAGIAKLLKTAHGRLILNVLNRPQPSDDTIVWIGEDWQVTFKDTPGEKTRILLVKRHGNQVRGFSPASRYYTVQTREGLAAAKTECREYPQAPTSRLISIPRLFWSDLMMSRYICRSLSP